MLARLERTLPRGDQWRCEPKLDGFRGLLWHAPGGGVNVLSRNLKDLGSAFPELVQAGEELHVDTLMTAISSSPIQLRCASRTPRRCQAGCGPAAVQRPAVAH